MHIESMEAIGLSILALCVFGGFAALMILRVTARYVEWELKVHDLRVETHRLRAEYERRRNVVRSPVECGVEFVDEEPAPLAKAA